MGLPGVDLASNLMSPGTKPSSLLRLLYTEIYRLFLYLGSDEEEEEVEEDEEENNGNDDDDSINQVHFMFCK